MGLEDAQFHLVDSVDEASELMRWLSTIEGPLAVDTETTGLSPEISRVRLVQVGDNVHGWAIPFERWGGVFEDILRRWTGRYTMHNATFDYAMLKHEGVVVPTHRVDDTRFMCHILEPNQSTALKNVASRHVHPKAAAMQRELDRWVGHGGKWSWADVPIISVGDAAVYWQYAALDAVLTRLVDDKLRPVVNAEAPRAYELELAVSWVTERMARRGCVIDREYAAENSDRFLLYIHEMEAWCKNNYDVKPGANADVIKILQADGIEFDKATASGAVSLDKEVLGRLDHPLAQAVLQRRKVQKLQSTYLRRFLEYSERDGLLHPSINTIGGSGRSQSESGGLFGVRTGRMSMDTPNLQQLPRHGTSAAGDVVRNCITAREDGVLLACDFDQVEMRMLAHLSKDETMRTAFSTGLDFFTAMARQVYDEPNFKRSDPRRQIVKNSGYAKAYGAGAVKFAETAGITVSQAHAFLTRFDQLYPGVRQFQRDVDRKAMERQTTEGVAYVRSPMTGRRHVADQKREYALVNYMIQGLAAETFKLKLLELDAAGLGKYMILPVHDEIILDVPLAHEADAIATLRAVMNDDKLFSVPLTASVTRGFRWGEKEKPAT